MVPMTRKVRRAAHQLMMNIEPIERHAPNKETQRL